MNRNAASLLLLIACALPSSWARADEEIKLAMRKIYDSIAIEIEIKLGVPKIPDSLNRPKAAGHI